MASPITSASFAKDLWPGVNKFFQTEYQAWADEWSQVFDVEGSDMAFEEDVGVSGLGLAGVKPEGQAIAYDDMEQNFVARYTHKVYAKGIIVTREANDDGRANVVGRQRARALARSMNITKETVHANVLNRAFNSSYTMGSEHDGKELLATDHPNGPYAGTYQNELTTAAQLSEAALEDLLILISQAKDARGLQIKLMGTRLIVPPALQFQAARILDSEMRSGTADNDVNVIRQANYLPGGHMVNHYLTSATAWFVKTNCPDGLKSFNRDGLEFTPDNDFDTENAKFKARERYAPGWSDPRGLYGTAGA